MSSTTATVSLGTGADDKSWIALVVISLFMSLTTLVVGLRIYTRVYLLKQLGWDDYCVILTLIIASADGGVVLSNIPYGLGKHTATLDPSLLVTYLRNFWLSIVMYNLSLAMIKLTFLFQYYRVLAIHKMKRVIIILGCIIMLWALSQVLVVIFACMPVQKFWQMDLEGKCMPNLPFWYINAAGNIASDLAIFIMPLPVLNRLQLRKKQKYFLMCIFSLGFFTCAISLIRLAYLKQSPDFTFENIPSACWSFGELSCGIICACLPTLRPLMTKIKPQWMISYATRNKRQTYGGASRQAKYGEGTKGISTELKSSTGNRTRKTEDTSSLTLSTTNLKNYSRLDDDNDIETAMRMPSPLSPAYRKPYSSSIDSESILHEGNAAAWTSMEQEGIHMQQLPPRPKQPHKAPDNDKAMEVLGMGFSGGGVSTQVVGGRHSAFLSTSNGDSLGGIEVKRDVYVTTVSVSER